MDSLGVDGKKLKALEKVFGDLSYVSYNATRLQDDESSTCGHFCVFFCHNRFYNNDLSYKDFMNIYFSSNVLKNERKVAKFIVNIS